MKKLRDKISAQLKTLKNTKFLPIFISQIIYKIASFASGIFAAHILTQTDYGVYSYAFNILSMCMLVNGLGVVEGILQFGNEHYNDDILKASYSRYGFKIGFTFNTLLSVGLLLFSLFAGNVFTIPSAIIIISIISFQPIFILLNNFMINNMRIFKEDTKYSVQNTISGVLVSLATILGSFFAGVKGIAFAHYIAYACAIIIALFLGRNFIKTLLSTKNVLTTAQKKAFMKFSLVLAVVYLVSHLLMLMDVFMIGIIIPDEAIIASYKVATIIPGAMVFVPSSLMIIAYPHFVRMIDNKKKFNQMLIKVVFYSTIFFVAICAILFIIAPFVITLVFGDKYLDSVYPFRILIVAFAFSASFNIPLSNIMTAKKYLKSTLFISIAMGLLNILLNALMIIRFGSVGAAYATLIVTAFGSMLYILMMMFNTRRDDYKAIRKTSLEGDSLTKEETKEPK